MTTRIIAELVLDYDVYPRMSIDTQHVAYMRTALEGGRIFPPLVICAKSKRIADGFHRHKLYLQVHGPDYKVEVIERTYKNDGELFSDAMRMNSDHGRALSQYDRTHCLLLAEKFKLTLDDTALALGMTVDKLTELRVHRVGTLSIAGRKTPIQVPLKRTISHMTGKMLSPEQAEVNEHLGGMNQLFYVNQLISLLEHGLIDFQNVDLLKRLQILAKLIGKLKQAA